MSIEKWHLKCEQEVALKVWVSIKNINAQIPCKRHPKLSLHATYPKCQITASFSGSLRKNLIDILLKRSTQDPKRFTVRLCIVTTRLSIEPKAFLALVYLLFQVCWRCKFKYYQLIKIVSTTQDSVPTGWTWLRHKGRLPFFLIVPSCFARMVFQPLLKFILNLTDSNKFSQAKHYSVIQQSTRIISNLRKIKNQVGGVLFCVSLNAIGTSTRCRGRQRFQDRWCDATLMFFTIPQHTSSNLFNEISNPHLII